MFKSIFGKLLFSYILVSLIGLISISVSIGYFYHKQIYKEKKVMLLKMAQRVNELSNMLITDEISTREYMRNLHYLERDEKVMVRLVTKNSYKGLRVIFNSDTEQIVGKETINEVFQGKEKFLTNNTERNDSFIILGMPFRVGSSVEGGVFLFTPVQNTVKIVRGMYNYIGVAFLIIIISTILVLYYLSKKFTKPLIAMSIAADELANGEFSHRIDVISYDEIGVLANSLNNMAEQLQRLEQARREFIANVSHELRTPLTTILANTKGIIDGVIREKETEDYLKVNIEETKRLSLLVNELIELSTLEKGNIKLDKQRTDISQLIESILKQMELKAREKNLKLDFNIQERIEGDIDKNRIKQVIINLIDNAIKYSPEGGEIAVSLKEKNGILYIEISDSGCGIPRDHLPMIFERFYKVGKDKGVGIGLSLSKGIVQVHGGQIQVESEEGKGAKFIIKIPL